MFHEKIENQVTSTRKLECADLLQNIKALPSIHKFKNSSKIYNHDQIIFIQKILEEVLCSGIKIDINNCSCIGFRRNIEAKRIDVFSVVNGVNEIVVNLQRYLNSNSDIGLYYHNCMKNSLPIIIGGSSSLLDIFTGMEQDQQIAALQELQVITCRWIQLFYNSFSPTQELRSSPFIVLPKLNPSMDVDVQFHFLNRFFAELQATLRNFLSIFDCYIDVPGSFTETSPSLRPSQLLKPVAQPLPAMKRAEKRSETSLLEWNYIPFRSKSEIRIAEAFDRAGVLFYPNAKCRIMTPQGMKTKESDFLVCQEGMWGILECDGEEWHQSAAKDHQRDDLFNASGIWFIKRYSAEQCYNEPDKVVSLFLSRMKQFYSRPNTL